MASSAFSKALGESVTVDILTEARDVIEAEGRAIAGLGERLGLSFVRVVDLVLHCSGRVVVTGMGKSGLVAQKISATLASTGTPSLFLHAAEAVHGDLGRITSEDVVLALSNSGESEEIVRLIRPLHDLGVALVAITGDEGSRLARHADMTVSLGNIAEACPMGLVPTASTTAMMVIGDALAMCVFNRRGWGREEYARFHPGGALGQKLLKVCEVMRRGEENPVVSFSSTIHDVLMVMTRTPGRPGAASVIDDTGKLVGFFTDGDLRRLITKGELNPSGGIESVMQRSPKSVGPEQLVEDAARLMREHQIDQVPVVDSHRISVGLLDIQDLLATRTL